MTSTSLLHQVLPKQHKACYTVYICSSSLCASLVKARHLTSRYEAARVPSSQGNTRAADLLDSLVRLEGLLGGNPCQCLIALKDGANHNLRIQRQISH